MLIHCSCLRSWILIIRRYYIRIIVVMIKITFIGSHGGTCDQSVWAKITSESQRSSSTNTNSTTKNNTIRIKPTSPPYITISFGTTMKNTKATWQSNWWKLPSKNKDILNWMHNVHNTCFSCRIPIRLI